MEPSISVIIPTYNRKRLVVEAIQSALVQEPKNFEIIVVDDGSTDGTVEYLHSLNLPIRLIESENRGVSHARNLGIRAVRGANVAFLDSDDLWLPGKLKRQLDYLDSHPDIPLVYTNEYIEEGGERLPQTRFDDYPPKTRFVLPYILMGAAIHSSSVMVRKQMLDKVGSFNEDMTMHEDTDLWDRICRESEVGYVEDPLTVYRWAQDPDHLSVSNRQEYLRNTKLYMERYLKRRDGGQLNIPEQYATEDTLAYLERVSNIID